MPPGRPSLYSAATAEVICARIADGEGLRSICRDEAMPGRQTVMDWLNSQGLQFDEFRAKYARARELQGDLLDEQIQQVADVATPEDVQVAKLRVETMKWRAAKLNPKKYGDKIQTEHSGAIGVGIAEVLRARRTRREELEAQRAETVPSLPAGM